MNIFYDQNYLRVIDDAFTPEFCEQMINYFEQDQQRHHHEGDRYIELDIFKKPRSKWTPLTAQIDKWRPLGDHVVQTVIQMTTDYRNHWDPLGMLPDSWALEGVRVKCYRPGQHEFRMHVDQANRDSAARFIAVLIYLNDNDAGTEFPNADLTVSAKQGRAVIFPPNWQYPHRGLMPKETTKYIASTYLHYKDIE